MGSILLIADAHMYVAADGYSAVLVETVNDVTTLPTTDQVASYSKIKIPWAKLGLGFRDHPELKTLSPSLSRAVAVCTPEIPNCDGPSSAAMSAPLPPSAEEYRIRGRALF